MALPSNIKLTKKEVSQEIDLEEIAGVDLSGDPSLKEVIGQALIDVIVERSKSGKDIDRTPFKKYPKSYKESDQYAAFGKTSNVNMDLTGNMLSDIDVKPAPGSIIKLGFRDSVNNAKSFNHMTGDTVKQRQFFGLRDKDVKDVLTRFQTEIDSLRPEGSSVNNFIGRITNGSELASTAGTSTTTATISIRDLFGESES